MDDVLLYWDRGVGQHTGEETFQSLSTFFDPSLNRVKKVNHHFLQTTDWEATTILLVIPGGRDIPYHELLKGEANRKIVQFVEQGGSYLGICAGAYYGCGLIEFEKGGALDVCASRELAFFPGIAKGPALGHGLFCYRSYSGAEATDIHTSFEGYENFSTSVFYNGGCTFVSPENYPQVKVLANYQPHLAAIVECRKGKGKAILCGVHPEVRAHSLAKLTERNPRVKEIYSQLIAAENSREKLWNLILSSCIF